MRNIGNLIGVKIVLLVVLLIGGLYLSYTLYNVKNEDVQSNQVATEKDEIDEIGDRFISENKDVILSYEQNVELLDDYNNKIVLLPGFKISNDSANSVEEGICIEDEIGNQFIWIPVGDEIGTSTGTKSVALSQYSYTDETQTALTYLPENGYVGSLEYAFGDGRESQVVARYIKEEQVNDSLIGENGTYIAKDIEEFIASVNENGGYYFARYQAKSNEGALYTIDGNLHTMINQDEAATIARSVYAENDMYECDLVNSYAYDTMIVYLATFVEDLDIETVQGEILKINDIEFEWTTETGFTDLDEGGEYLPCIARVWLERVFFDLGITNQITGFRSILYVK